MGGATLLSGQLDAGFGGRTYWAMAAIAGVGLAASLALRRSCVGPEGAGASRASYFKVEFLSMSGCRVLIVAQEARS